MGDALRAFRIASFLAGMVRKTLKQCNMEGCEWTFFRIEDAIFQNVV